jgi:hypothetical protein
VLVHLLRGQGTEAAKEFDPYLALDPTAVGEIPGDVASGMVRLEEDHGGGKVALLLNE